jgi:hypothetical protein
MVYRSVAPCQLSRNTRLTPLAVAYALAIYLLNLFLAFLSPKFDPSSDALDNEMEDGSVGSLPTRADDEFRPFIRRLPEFKFWYWATRAIVIGFSCSWFEIFNIPVFWPVLLVYWIMLFFLTSKAHFLSSIYSQILTVFVFIQCDSRFSIWSSTATCRSLLARRTTPRIAPKATGESSSIRKVSQRCRKGVAASVAEQSSMCKV